MKTLAIRLEDDLHAQLSAIAQLSESTITDEIRQAIEAHLAHKRQSPELTQRASAALDEIERDADTRRAAIQKLFGDTEAPVSEDPKTAKNTRPSAPKQTNG